MTHDSSSNDSLLSRMRDTLRRASRIPTVRAPRAEAVEAPMRDAVRTLARERVNAALRQLRAAHNLSYEEVAARSGLSPQRLWDVEYGGQRLTLGELQRLAACYQLTASDILGIDLGE